MKPQASSFLFTSNFFILLLVITNIIGIIAVFFASGNKDSIEFLSYTILSITATLLCIYLFFSIRYAKDVTTLLGLITKTIQNEKISSAEKPMNFAENKRIETLFNRAYVKSNLIKKDYDDLKTVFKKLIPHDIFSQINQRGIDRVALGNWTQKPLTIMFIDIVGFTTISEKLPPEHSLALLNIYFDGIGEIILSHGGYIDKFLGDGMLAIFEQVHSDNAIECSVQIQEFIGKFKITEPGKRIEIGIGINSWEVIMGTIGTKKRMDATVIGDTVNTAARIQTLTREYHTNILISESSKKILEHPERFELQSIGREHIRGKETEVELWSVSRAH